MSSFWSNFRTICLKYIEIKFYVQFFDIQFQNNTFIENTFDVRFAQKEIDSE